MTTNISDIYTTNSNFLKHADLKGQKVSITIKSAEVGEVGDKKQVVLGFKESDKVLGLNKTNANMIAFLTGTEDYTNWIGTRITIKPSMTEYQGKPTPCIRVADELPQQKKAAATAGSTRQESREEDRSDDWDDDNPIF